MSSDVPEIPATLRQVRRDVREFIKLFDGLLDSIVEEMLDAVHFQAGVFEVTIDPIILRPYSEIDRQLSALPGKPPTVPLVSLTHAAL